MLANVYPGAVPAAALPADHWVAIRHPDGRSAWVRHTHRIVPFMRRVTKRRLESKPPAPHDLETISIWFDLSASGPCLCALPPEGCKRPCDGPDLLCAECREHHLPLFRHLAQDENGFMGLVLKGKLVFVPEPGLADHVPTVKGLEERIARLEELAVLLSKVYYLQDEDRISVLKAELWPGGGPC